MLFRCAVSAARLRAIARQGQKPVFTPRVLADLACAHRVVCNGGNSPCGENGLSKRLRHISGRQAPNAFSRRCTAQLANLTASATIALLTVLGMFASPPMATAEATYLGNAACTGCHEEGRYRLDKLSP